MHHCLANTPIASWNSMSLERRRRVCAQGRGGAEKMCSHPVFPQKKARMRGPQIRAHLPIQGAGNRKGWTSSVAFQSISTVCSVDTQNHGPSLTCPHTQAYTNLFHDTGTVQARPMQPPHCLHGLYEGTKRWGRPCSNLLQLGALCPKKL